MRRHYHRRIIGRDTYIWDVHINLSLNDLPYDDLEG